MMIDEKYTHAHIQKHRNTLTHREKKHLYQFFHYTHMYYKNSPLLLLLFKIARIFELTVHFSGTFRTYSLFNSSPSIFFEYFFRIDEFRTKHTLMRVIQTHFTFFYLIFCHLFHYNPSYTI